MIVFQLRSQRVISSCPVCGCASARIHSSYQRTLADVPCGMRAVCLHLSVRKFFCSTEDCPQRIFTERIPDVVKPWARKTLQWFTLMLPVAQELGGRPAERLGTTLHMPVSDQSALRYILRYPDSPAAPVKILGVDEFAFHRRQTYGTVLVDLERHRVIDLLPDRSQVTFAKWLQKHPEINVISRDRGGDYAAGARLGAPQARQVADRFHLIKNSGEAMERILTRHHAVLLQAAKAIAPQGIVARTTKRTPAEVAGRAQRRAQRLHRYEEVQRLAREGHYSSVRLANRSGSLVEQSLPICAPKTSRNRLRTPENARSIPTWLICSNVGWLENTMRVNCGTKFALKAFPEPMNRFVVLSMRGEIHPLLHLLPPTSLLPLHHKRRFIIQQAKTRWLLEKASADCTVHECNYVQALYQICPSIQQAHELLYDFHTLMMQHDSRPLDAWLQRCELSHISELVGFAQGIRRDYQAVKAGCDVIEPRPSRGTSESYQDDQTPNVWSR